MRITAAVVSLLVLSTLRSNAAEPDPRVANLRAFAKTYGYVRFFHPSDEAARIDWNRFAILGAGRVAQVSESKDLRPVLESLFLPIAPSMQFLGEGQVAEPMDNTNGEGAPIVAWQHLGVGLEADGSPYRSVRLNRKSVVAPAESFGGIVQTVSATALRGKEVRLSASGKAAVEGTGNQLQFWLRVDRPNRQMGFFNNMDERPIRTPEWRAYEITGRMADDAERIAFGAFLAGSGRAWVDGFRLQVREADGEWVDVSIANATFEADAVGQPPALWHGRAPGYRFKVQAEERAEGKQAVILEGGEAVLTAPLFDAQPKLGELIDRQLLPSLRVRIPLALRSSDGHTIPRAAPAAMSALEKAIAELDLAASTAKQRDVRLAGVIILWNVLQHFYPYFDVVKTDWDSVLTSGFTRALNDANDEQFRETLRWMMVQLADGHGGVYHSGLASGSAAMPFLIDWIEGKAVVVAVAEGATLKVGDVVISMDGEAAGALMDRHVALRSGSPQWKRATASRQLVFGPKDATVRLAVERAGEKLELDVARTSTTPLPERRPENFSEVRPGIHYVDLSTAEIEAIDAAIQKLAAGRGVVFDLRGYPKGNHDVLRYLTSEPLRSPRWQIPQRIYPDQERLVGYDESGRWTMEPKEPRIRGKVVFLTGGGAISYAESVMGIVEHYKLATIVGGPTAGANGNVNAINLPGGFRVSFTGMRVIKHDGSQHHLVGIAADVPVERTVAGVRAGRDEVLEKALEQMER